MPAAKPSPTSSNQTDHGERFVGEDKQANTSESDVLVDEEEELCSEQPYRRAAIPWHKHGMAQRRTARCNMVQ